MSLFGLMESYGANFDCSTVLSQDDIDSIVEKKNVEVAKAAVDSYAKSIESLQNEIDNLDPSSATYDTDLASKQQKLKMLYPPETIQFSVRRVSRLWLRRFHAACLQN